MPKKSKNFTYGMKAAPLYLQQLLNRISKFRRLLMDPIIELHLYGSRDIFNHNSMNRCIENCRRLDAEFYVHFPVQDPQTYGVYDPAVHSDSYFEKVVNFSQKIKAKAIVMHRVYGIGMTILKNTAVSHFNENVIHWAKIAYPMQIYVENYSFIWLPKNFKQDFVLSPLDHFFPWEIKEFIKFMEENKISNVSVMVDIAHATISSNMFNLAKYNEVFRRDARFGNIFLQDLSETTFLRPEDFLIEGIAPYFHISDSLLISDPYKINLPLNDYLTTEGLSIGKGNLYFREILQNVPKDSTLIMEISSLNRNGVNDNFLYEDIKQIQRMLDKSQKKRKGRKPFNYTLQ